MRKERQQLLISLLQSGLYKATANGEVFSCRKKGRHLPTNNWVKLTAHKAKIGYRTVWMSHNKMPVSFLVHSVVWIAHNGFIPEGLEINHLDGNKANNALSNLELTTRSGNLLHAFQTGLAPIGSKTKAAKLTEAQVIEIKDLLRTTKLSQREIAEQFGVSHTAIREINKLHTWKHVA